MSGGTWPNLAAMFFDQAERLGDAPFLWAKRDGAYAPVTWTSAADWVARLASGLGALGIVPGDRVVLVSENRPGWLISDLAIMAAGAITVPAYTTNTEADHLHVLSDSGARGAIVSTPRLAHTLMAAARRSPDVEFVITMEAPDAADTEHTDGPRLLGLDDMLVDDGPGSGSVAIAEAARRLSPDDTACIIYTSGTGGAPKGVMLSHRAILHNCAGARDALMELGLGHEVFLSFLPLSHAYEHTAGQFFPISIGAEIYYAEGIDTLAANMAEVRPTLMTAVPRLYETLHARITRDVGRASGLRRALFQAALDLGRRRYEAPQGMSVGQRLMDRVVERLVRDKVRARFGGRLKAMVSGGAALNPDIGLFFTALGLTILQGYGQTEAAPVITANSPRNNKLHTVGAALTGVDLRIAEDGEILVRGDLLMQGYWRNEAATAEALRDGWLHTGDIGELDAEGCLRITDRKKDIIVNSGGDNISPQRIEGMLTMEPEIAQAMVHGDRHPHLVALLVPDAEWIKAWAKEHDTAADLAVLADDAQVEEALRAVIERVNDKLSTVEKIRRFRIAAEPFSINNEQLTPTLKIRRHKIKEIHGEALEGLYRPGPAPLQRGRRKRGRRKIRGIRRRGT